MGCAIHAGYSDTKAIAPLVTIFQPHPTPSSDQALARKAELSPSILVHPIESRPQALLRIYTRADLPYFLDTNFDAWLPQALTLPPEFVLRHVPTRD